jgi:uncharacterized RDD family membrane protein YckC
MDDAREWAATAPRAGVDAPEALQPGDPWGAPLWRSAPGDARSDERSPDAAAPAPPAGVGRRAAALVVDLVLVATLQAVGGGLAAGLGALAPRFYLVARALSISWQLVVPVAYFVLGHGTGGQTIGKRLFGARVVDERGAPIGYVHALGRCLATVLAAVPLGIGLAMAGLRADRRGLHDLLAGTWVVCARGRTGSERPG